MCLDSLRVGGERNEHLPNTYLWHLPNTYLWREGKQASSSTTAVAFSIVFTKMKPFPFSQAGRFGSPLSCVGLMPTLPSRTVSMDDRRIDPDNHDNGNITQPTWSSTKSLAQLQLSPSNNNQQLSSRLGFLVPRVIPQMATI